MGKPKRNPKNKFIQTPGLNKSTNLITYDNTKEQGIIEINQYGCRKYSDALYVIEILKMFGGKEIFHEWNRSIGTDMKEGIETFCIQIKLDFRPKAIEQRRKLFYIFDNLKTLDRKKLKEITHTHKGAMV